MTNLVLATDSYKLNHWHQYPSDTEGVYSYFESRQGAQWPYVVWFGLQYVLKRYLTGVRVTQHDIDEAQTLAGYHFGDEALFNRAGWMHILEKHGGRLPVRILAVPEGTIVPTGNVMMTVENTDPECFWLTNALESLLTHVWYPSTVATLSRTTKEICASFLAETAMSMDALPFMLHDFGFRGASSQESAEIGGAAHLLNFMGTDTVPAMLCARDYYGASLENLAFSVPATEHSVMTATGEAGEFDLIKRLLHDYPTGILSIVGDSYNIYRVAGWLGNELKEDVLAREGKTVLRPDSTTPTDRTPEALTVNLAETLWHDFRGEVNPKGYKVLDSHIGLLWGDGIDPTGIELILKALSLHSFSAETMVFGMGGGLLQKVNRDIQRFAFKASAIKRGGEWHDIFKKPLDASKASKAGRLALYSHDGEVKTVREHDVGWYNALVKVFENGELLVDQTFDEIRGRAALVLEAQPVA